MNASPTVESPGVVALETVIVESPEAPLIALVRSLRRTPDAVRNHLPANHRVVRIPSAATRVGVPGNVYDGYRLGLACACADVVLVREAPGGLPHVPLLRRARPPFEGYWWLMGGAIFNFRPIQHFLMWKVYRECGLEDVEIEEFVQKHALADTQYSCEDLDIVGCLGVCRTAAEDTVGKVCDTTNFCYMGIYRGDRELYHDKDHSDIRWVAERDLTPGSYGHWYPEWAVSRALRIYWMAQDVSASPRVW